MLTSFGQVEFLLEKIRNKAEQSDEAAKAGANNVKIVDRKSRHLGTPLAKTAKSLV